MIRIIQICQWYLHRKNMEWYLGMMLGSMSNMTKLTRSAIKEYFLVIIHLRSFQGGFAYSEVEGITSPAYTIIEFKDKSQNDGLYWKYVLSSKEFIKRLETVTYGIRDGRSISFEDFAELKFMVPQKEEQKQIGKLLLFADCNSRKVENKITKLRTMKQSLLQKMFV